MNAIYLMEEELGEVRRKGYIVEYCRKDWQIGQTIDVFGGPHDIGLTGTVTEIYKDGKCLIEIW